MIIGVASFFGVCVLLAGFVFIIVSALLYWRKHIRERQYEGKTLAVILNSIVTVLSFILNLVEQRSEPPIALLPKKASDADTQKDERCAWVCA